MRNTSGISSRFSILRSIFFLVRGFAPKIDFPGDDDPLADASSAAIAVSSDQ